MKNFIHLLIHLNFFFSVTPTHTPTRTLYISPESFFIYYFADISYQKIDFNSKNFWKIVRKKMMMMMILMIQRAQQQQQKSSSLTLYWRFFFSLDPLQQNQKKKRKIYILQNSIFSIEQIFLFTIRIVECQRKLSGEWQENKNKKKWFWTWIQNYIGELLSS